MGWGGMLATNKPTALTTFTLPRLTTGELLQSLRDTNGSKISIISLIKHESGLHYLKIRHSSF